jgi:hypothetical protein
MPYQKSFYLFDKITHYEPLGLSLQEMPQKGRTLGLMLKRRGSVKH